jgi:hydrogenase nickel incorporation protein HypA/HybF
MHESSLVAGLIGRLEALSREQGSARIVSVKVRLGALSHISAEHFRGHFDQAARGTVAEGASLDVEALTDIRDASAQDVVLESVEVET